MEMEQELNIGGGGGRRESKSKIEKEIQRMKTLLPGQPEELPDLEYDENKL